MGQAGFEVNQGWPLSRAGDVVPAGEHGDPCTLELLSSPLPGPACGGASWRWCGFKSTVCEESKYSALRQTGTDGPAPAGWIRVRAALFLRDEPQSIRESGRRALDADLGSGSWRPSGCCLQKGGQAPSQLTSALGRITRVHAHSVPISRSTSALSPDLSSTPRL